MIGYIAECVAENFICGRTEVYAKIKRPHLLFSWYLRRGGSVIIRLCGMVWDFSGKG